MYSDIWLPALLDSANWLSSLLSIRLNCIRHKNTLSIIKQSLFDRWKMPNCSAHY